MKLRIILPLIFLTIPLFASASFPENFGGNGEAWYNDFNEHYVNTNNSHVRKDWQNHLFAMPARPAGENANENAAVLAHPNGEDTLVDPHGICETTSICQ